MSSMKFKKSLFFISQYFSAHISRNKMVFNLICCFFTFSYFKVWLSKKNVFKFAFGKNNFLTSEKRENANLS